MGSVFSSTPTATFHYSLLEGILDEHPKFFIDCKSYWGGYEIQIFSNLRDDCIASIIIESDYENRKYRTFPTSYCYTVSRKSSSECLQYRCKLYVAIEKKKFTHDAILNLVTKTKVYNSEDLLLNSFQEVTTSLDFRENRE
jgi:hypothetical protein